MGRLALGLALPAQRFFLHHRNSRPVHLYIQNGNRIAGDGGQVQLEGSLDLSLLALSDIRADGLRRPLHRFGGHFQAGQNSHLFAAMVEGPILAHHRLHAAHPGREFCVFNVQFDIDGELPLLTVGAPIIGTRHFHRAHRGQHRLGAQLPVVRPLAARTRKGALVGRRGRELEQFGQGGGPGPMQGRPQRRLHRFQIGAAVLATLSKDTAQELIYFPRHLLMEGSSRFFSSAVHVPASSSTGRRRQIFSFTAVSSALSLWKRRNSSTSRCALRSAAGLLKVSATVLPSTLAVRRKWGPWPGSPAFAQWQFGLLQRPMTPRIEPGRKSPSCVIWRTTSERPFSRAGSDWGIRDLLVLEYILH